MRRAKRNFTDVSSMALFKPLSVYVNPRGLLKYVTSGCGSKWSNPNMDGLERKNAWLHLLGSIGTKRRPIPCAQTNYSTWKLTCKKNNWWHLWKLGVLPTQIWGSLCNSDSQWCWADCNSYPAIVPATEPHNPNVGTLTSTSCGIEPNATRIPLQVHCMWIDNDHHTPTWTMSKARHLSSGFML